METYDSILKFDEDDKGCGSCAHHYPHLVCVYKDDCNCGFAVDYCMYERKKVLSGNVYNMDADEVFGKELKFYPGKEENIKVDTEYICSKNFNLDDVSKSDISGSVFKKMYQITDPQHFFEKGSEIDREWMGTPIEHELELLGFIEENVEDYDIHSDSVFKIGINLYRPTIEGNGKIFLRPVFGWGYWDMSRYSSSPCKLSDLVDKSDLKRFKKVNVTVTVEED